MIIFRNRIEKTPVGRDVKLVKADFIDGTIPSWLSVPAGTTVENNGITTQVPGNISTIPFTVHNNIPVNGSNRQLFILESASIAINNWRASLESSDCSIKIKSSNGVVIGVYGESNSNYFRVYLQGEESTADVEVELSTTQSKLVSVGNPKYTSRPKNIEITIQPEIGQFHLGINGGVTYTYWELESLAIDWSGTWQFEVTCSGKQSLSSVEFEIQQNI